MRRAVVLGVVTLLACSTASTEAPRQTAASHTSRTGRVASAIINGTVDTTHPAVVYLLLATPEGGAACTGTIVKVDAAAHVGWIATAAHCIQDATPYAAYLGTDVSDLKTIELPALDWAYDARFQLDALDQGYDFGVIRVAGVDATTPVLPLTTSPDGLAVGSTIDSVGYGRTTVATAPDENNTIRHHVAKPLSAVSDIILDYDEPTSGGCFGDSGGPMLLGAGANTKIVGIHSYTVGDCDVAFSGARVTSGLAFFDEQLAKAVPAPSCDTCRAFARAPGGACEPRWADCKADANCSDYLDCIIVLADASRCDKLYPLGAAPYARAVHCSCTETCTDACKADAYCGAIPKCGVVAPEKLCNSCIESACCAEAQACAGDAECYACWNLDPQRAGCAKNKAHAALDACAKTTCAATCGPPPPPPPLDAGAPDAHAPDAEAPASTSSSSSSSSGTVAVAPPPDAGAESPEPAASGEDDGCNASRRAPGSGRGIAFVLFGLALLVRLRPCRSARR